MALQSKSDVYLQSALTVLLLCANLFALNLLFRSTPLFRMDLTEDKEFSLTSVTRDLISDLDEELTIFGYFSGRSHPKLAPLVPQIRDMLEEYSVVSGKKVKVVFCDPRSDESIETEAKQRFGVDPMPFSVSGKYENAIINTYFHLVVSYGDQYVRYSPFDLIEVEPDASGTDVVVKLRNLEYDLTKAIKKVLFGFQSVDALFADLSDPVEVVAWISPEAELPDDAKEIPQLLEKVCAELAESAGGRFRLTKEAAPTERAAQEGLYRDYGVRPFSLGFFDSRTFYCSAILRVGKDLIPLYLFEKEAPSEASIREGILGALRRLVPGFLKTIGMSRPGPEFPPEVMAQMGRRPEPPDFEVFRAQIEGDNKGIEDVNLEEGVDPSVDVLFVMKPTNLTEEAVFELDQYLMRGGKVVLALDRYELDKEKTRARIEIKENSNAPLDKWLTHIGVTPKRSLVQDDRNSPFIIPQIRRIGMLEVEEYVELEYPWFVEAGSGGMADHPAVSGLERLTFFWASPLEIDEERTAELDVTPLVKTSDRAWTDVNLNVNPGSNDIADGGRWYSIPAETSQEVLAVSLVGSFTSYYKDHAPPGEEEPKEEEGDDEEFAESADDDTAPRRSFITQSPETRLVVIGDSELFSEQFARMTRRPEFEGNLQFALNLVDWSLEDNDMIRIRSRGATARPLDELETSTRKFVESANYVLPAAVIVVLGCFLAVRRRNPRPMTLS